jgi:hypothetical protein
MAHQGAVGRRKHSDAGMIRTLVVVTVQVAVLVVVEVVHWDPQSFLNHSVMSKSVLL